MKTKDKILIVATRARATIEKLNSSLGLAARTSACLERLCGVASGHLFTQLRKAKLKARIRMNDCHCFVEYGGFIVDITATQFGRRKVLIIPTSKKRQSYHTNKSFTYKSLRGFIKGQKRERWDSEQQYQFYTERLELLDRN
jgi:hypothetical protein